MDRCLDGKIFDYSFIQAFTLPSSRWKESQSSLCSFFKCIPNPVCLSRNPVTTASSPVISPIGVHFAATTTNQQAAATTSPPQANMATIFDPMAFMKQFADQMMVIQQKSQTIVVEPREDKTRKTEAKFNNNMLQLLLLGIIDPQIAKYTQAMKNILLQPALVRAISMANILTTVFSKIPTDLDKRLSAITTGKSMNHISKNFASALLGANFLRSNLESFNYETNSINILSFVAQSNLAKVNAHCDAEQVARNERSLTLLNLIARRSKLPLKAWAKSKIRSALSRSAQTFVV